MTVQVAIIGFPGCLGSSVHGPADLFATANTIAQHMGRHSNQFQTRILSCDARPVHSANGHLITADGDIKQISEADIIIVPGIGISSLSDMESRLDALQPVIKQLQSCAATNKIIATSCTGTFLAAEAGLLDGKRATTTWWLEDSFRARYKEIDLMADQILVDEGLIITSAAGTSYLDLTLHLIDRFAGPSLARLCARYMVVDGGRKSQRAYAVPTHFKRRDELIERADAWIRDQGRGKITVEALAGYLGVSSRTLIRRIKKQLGMTSQAFIREIKMDQAKTLLDTTPDTIASIGAEVGYDDENAFRRSFTSYIGLSPTQYRSQFKNSR